MPQPDPIGTLEGQLQSLLGEAAPAPPARERKPTVLIIDDNEDYRVIVRSYLKEHAYDVLEAGDGAAGLALIRDKKPDLVIVDFNMPRKNGYEVIQEVRSLFETRKLPIIMFSGAANRRHLKDLRLDISEFLDKPVPNGRLLEAVAKALGPSPAAACPPLPVAPKTETVLLEEDDGLETLALDSEAKPAEEGASLELLANDSPVIARVNKILTRAVEMKASDIHIEPQETQIGVRVRLDGSLKALASLPISVHPRLAARVKIMSNLVITEHRLPQDGQFRAVIKGQKIEFRVSTMPSTYGEKIVIRVLGQSKLKGDLAALGFDSRGLDCVERALRCPSGLILVTGPTGSGKTTSLYTMLAVLNNPDVNIVTAEDPVEYRLSGITQVPVHPAIGLTFESVLRAFLRQDPDIMLVGEIRDQETAEIAIKASITGHLVLSTLHTNSAPATITRLVNMGVAPYLVAASVRMVIAQRLVKLLCPSCKIASAPTEDDRRFLTGEEAARLRSIFRGRGCAECRQTGYSGRAPVYEVMPVRTPAMRQAIQESASADAIQTLAAREGMTSLRRAALDAVEQGRTSLPEALKLIMGE